MNVYVLILAGGVVTVLVILGAYFGFFKAGTSSGAAVATATQAQNDLTKLKKADSVAMTEKSPSDIVKSLNNGTF